MDRWLEQDDERWAAFDVALRGIDCPAPAGLREACLPGAERAAVPEHGPGETPVGRSILVVDDEPNIRRLVEVQLTRAGYAVLQAGSGAAALELVRTHRPDLVVLDVMMSGLNGFQVLAALKGDPETAAIPVVMLTARGQDDDVRHGWQVGADFYLPKPFNPAELRLVVDRMTAVLGTPEAPPPLRRWLK